MVPDLVLATVTAAPASPDAVALSLLGGDLWIPFLLLLGALFILLETALPGGLLGVIGFGLFLAAVVVATKRHGGDAGLVVLAIGMGIAFVVIAVGWYRLPRSRFAKRFFLRPSPGGKTDPATVEAKAKTSIEVGAEGTSLSDLRPAGMAHIGQWRVDVVTRGEFIEENMPLEVIAIDGTRIVVRAKPEGSAPTD